MRVKCLNSRLGALERQSKEMQDRTAPVKHLKRLPCEGEWTCIVSSCTISMEGWKRGADLEERCSISNLVLKRGEMPTGVPRR